MLLSLAELGDVLGQEDGTSQMLPNCYRMVLYKRYLSSIMIALCWPLTSSSEWDLSLRLYLMVPNL